MPQDNAERVRSIYEAFARGDVPTAMAGMDPGIEWNEAENFIYADGNPYIGPQAVLAGVFARLGSQWSSFAVVPDEILGSGDSVISLGRYRGTYRTTGARVDAQFVHVFKFRDGKVVKFQQYTDTAQFRDVVSRGSSATAD